MKAYTACLHDQNKSVFFEGPAVIQPIKAIWEVFKKPWLVGKEPALQKKRFCFHCVARNFDWGEGQNRKILCRYFDDVRYFDDDFRCRNCNYVAKWHVIIEFLEFDFIKINLKKHNLAKLHNFTLPKLKIKGRWGRKAPSAWRFLKIFMQ